MLSEHSPPARVCRPRLARGSGTGLGQRPGRPREDLWFQRDRGGMAGGPGFEPGLLGPEPRVLPLNYPPAGSDCRCRAIFSRVRVVRQPLITHCVHSCSGSATRPFVGSESAVLPLHDPPAGGARRSSQVLAAATTIGRKVSVVRLGFQPLLDRVGLVGVVPRRRFHHPLQRFPRQIRRKLGSMAHSM